MSVSKSSARKRGAKSESNQTSDSNASGQTGHLIADADSALTEVFVIDGKFKLVKKDLGKLEVDLPSGLYMVKFKAASLIKEQYVELQAGKTVRVNAGAMLFSTSAPLNNTGTTHEYHQDPAKALSKEVHLKIGTGSQLFVFLRELETPSAQEFLTGLTVHDLDGRVLLNSSKVSQNRYSKDDPHPWACSNIELNPGTYRLRSNLGEAGVIEQTVVCCPNWQTQVFLLRRSFGYGRKVRRADLPHASILMSQTGLGFDPSRSDLRRTELARQGLANGRAVMSSSEMQKMIEGKFENPMLGIYGAHLLLLHPSPDRALIGEVTSNLHGLVGNHPDVAALDLWLGHQTAQAYAVPPMLRSSWDIVVRESAARPELVPPDSLAAHIGDRLWNEGAWLVWLKPPEEATGEVSSVDLSMIHSMLPQITTKLLHRSSVDKISQKAGLTDLETGLLRYISTASGTGGIAMSQVRGTQGITKAQETLSKVTLKRRFSAEAMVGALGVPRATAGKAMAGLISKMKLKV